MINLEIVRFCAEECERQQSGELSVSYMVNAWNAVTEWWEPTRASFPNDVCAIARMIEPEKNQEGFRKIPVTINHKAIPVTDFERKLDLLFTFVTFDGMTPEEFYREFEIAHPFVDGNGRVGAILYNWFKKTMEKPVIAPDFKDDPSTFRENALGRIS